MIDSTETVRSRKPKILVAYHNNCIDGFTSAWIAYSALTDTDGPNAAVTLLPMNYTAISDSELYAALKEGDYLDLYIVDFSLDCKLLAYIASTMPHLNVVILDHHKTAFEKYMPGVVVERDTSWQGRVHKAMVYLDNDVCGAGICWDYFYPGTPIPKLVSYVQDYDLWRFNYGETTRYLNQYLRTKPRSIEVWDAVAKGFQNSDLLATYVLEGKHLQLTHNSCVARICQQELPLTLFGHCGAVVECAPEFVSDVGHRLAESTGTFGAMYYTNKETGDVTFSLRSVASFDVSEIAAKLGGGGHKNAAGFTLPAGADIGNFLAGAET